MILLDHPSGGEIDPPALRGWFDTKLRRLAAYWALGDRERALEESRQITNALQRGSLTHDDLERRHDPPGA